MRSLRYLNTVLTIIAVLLTLHLWTLWTGGPSAGAVAEGPRLELVQSAYAQGIPNAAAQRKQTNELLKLLVRKTEELTGLFRSGSAKVRVTAPADKKTPKAKS